MKAAKNVPLPAHEREFRLRNMAEHHIETMRDTADFISAVGKLIEAKSMEEDDQDGIMTPLVLNGLAKGLLMVAARAYEGADRTELRLQGELRSGE